MNSHVVHVRDTYEDRSPAHVATEVYLDGRKMTLTEDGLQVSSGPDQATTVTFTVVAKVVRFTGPDEPVEFRLLHDETAA